MLPPVPTIAFMDAWFAFSFSSLPSFPLHYPQRIPHARWFAWLLPFTMCCNLCECVCFSCLHALKKCRLILLCVRIQRGNRESEPLPIMHYAEQFFIKPVLALSQS